MSAVLKVGDTEFSLRFTMGGLKRIKLALGKPLLSWLQDSERLYDTEDLLKILSVGLKDGGNPQEVAYLEDNLEASQFSEIMEILMSEVGGPKVKAAMDKAKAEELGGDGGTAPTEVAAPLA
jgi:hypothetical protein